MSQGSRFLTPRLFTRREYTGHRAKRPKNSLHTMRLSPDCRGSHGWKAISL